MLLASFSEVMSIGAIVPFLSVLTTPETVFNTTLAQPLIHYFNITAPQQLLLPLTLLFSSMVALSGMLRYAVMWVSTRLSFAVGADLGIEIYRRTLYQPYQVHISRNSSEIITSIYSKTGSAINVINSAAVLCSSAIMLISILFALVALNPIIALSAFVGFGFIYGSIIRLTHSRIMIESQCIANESTRVIKALQEGLGGIRDVLIDGTQETYCSIYQKSDFLLRRAQSRNAFIGFSPRYGIEMLGTLLITVLAYFLAKETAGISKVVPTLGALALGAQRLLPVLQHGYQSLIVMKSDYYSLSDVLGLLNQPLPNQLGDHVAAPLPFKQSIYTNKLWFKYAEDQPWVLKGIDITIPKGGRVGIIGSTGSGKSTLLDIIMGLLHTSKGSIDIDGHAITADNAKAWQAHLAHVPQSIFLSDTSILENIAFGIPKDQIDYDRVIKAAKDAQIVSTIETLPDGYMTLIGERGVRLSGGQRQRIGIARALYKKADVIILDEATSALDNETEKAVMSSVEDLGEDLTIIIVAHRLSTLKNCTSIIELKDGTVYRTGSYQQLIS